MKAPDVFQEAYVALSANKVRSGLTVLGIVIGIASVIAMVSIGQGAAGQIQASIEGLGSNLLTVMPGILQPGRGLVSSGRGAAQTLDNDDIAVLEKVGGVAFVSPELQRRFQIVSSAGNNINSTVIGVGPVYEQVRNVAAAAGIFITDSQVRSMAKAVVLGPTVALDLFGESEPVGRTIRINGINFKVVGLLQSKGGAGFFNPDDTVFVPLSTMQKILAGVDYLSDRRQRPKSGINAPGSRRDRVRAGGATPG